MNKGGTPENLKPFKKGHDPRRNPGGFPGGIQPKKLLTHTLARRLKNNPKLAEELIDALLEAAVDTKHPAWLGAFRQTHDMQDGPIPKAVEATVEATQQTYVVHKDETTEPEEDGEDAG